MTFVYINKFLQPLSSIEVFTSPFTKASQPQEFRPLVFPLCNGQVTAARGGGGKFNVYLLIEVPIYFLSQIFISKVCLKLYQRNLMRSVVCFHPKSSCLIRRLMIFNNPKKTKPVCFMYFLNNFPRTFMVLGILLRTYSYFGTICIVLHTLHTFA
mgnify:CR=1 FL=1